MTRFRPLLLLGALPLLLAACTGTDEVGSAINLAVQSADNTLLIAVAPSGNALPAVTTSGPITGLTTANVGANLALSFPDRAELRAADGQSVLRTLGHPAPDYDATGGPDFTPCYRQVVAGGTGDTRLALFSDPGDAGSQLAGCTPGSIIRDQWVAVYQADGTLLYEGRLPAPSSGANPADAHLALVGDTLYVVRRLGPTLGSTASEIDRVTADVTSDPDRQAQVVAITRSAPLINDVAVLGTSVYAATDSGVQLLSPDAGTLSAPLGGFGSLGKASRVWAGQNLLAAWNADSGTLLVRYRDASGNFQGNLQFTALTSLQDVVFGPDGFLYLLLPGGLSGYDIVGYASGGRTFTAPPAPSFFGPEGRRAAFAVP